MPSLLGVPVDAAYHVVNALSVLLAPLAGGLAVAVAIVAFTVAVRLLVLPFSYYAMRGQVAQARIAPQVQALRQRHAKQPDRLQRELTALYKKNGTSMFAGCLPLLLQWPILSVMYLLFRTPVIGGAPNSLLAHYLFGAQLGSHWLAGAGLLSVHGAVFAALFALLAVIGWLSARAARRMAPSAGPSDPAVRAGGARAGGARAGGARSDGARSASARSASARSGAQAASGRSRTGRPGSGETEPAPAAVPAWLTRLTPYVTPVIAAFMPLAAGLYLLTTTGWTLLERTLLARALAAASPVTPVAPAGPVSDRRPGGLLRGFGGLVRGPRMRRSG
jgi:YidC/Oxa1 family membrane protein insertase